MNLAFANFHHAHIWGLYREAEKNPGVQIAGCYEEDASIREKLRKDGLCFPYDAYMDLLRDPQVDTVVIGSYFASRGQMIIAALQNGKHVFCDKPLCTSLEELNEIRRIAHEKGLKVGCMLDLRFLPQFLKAKALLACEEIGKVNNLSFSGQHTLNLLSRPGWYFEDGKHGGTLNDLGIHGMDAVTFLTGRRLKHVQFARMWNAFAEPYPHFPDCAQFMADVSGIQVFGDVSYSAPPFPGCLPTYWQFTLWGTKGMMTFNLKEPLVTVYTEKETVYCLREKEPYFLDEFMKEQAGEPSLLQTESILNAQEDILKIQACALTLSEKQEKKTR